MKHVADEAVYTEFDDRLVRAVTTASSLKAEQDSGNINKTQSRTKTTQALEIDSLKRRVKKLEKKQKSSTYKLKRLYKVGLSARVESSNDNEYLGEDASKQGRKIHDIDADEDITLVNVVGEVNADSIATTDSATATMTVDEVTLAQALMDIKTKTTEGKTNRPPIRAQQRSIMCICLKNIEGWKHNSLKNKSFANIQELFDKAIKWVNTFVDNKTELVEESSKKAEAELMEGSLKRAGMELEQEGSKRA
nr:hypothetical protein [Tanacetum cinerariifolium]